MEGRVSAIAAVLSIIASAVGLLSGVFAARAAGNKRRRRKTGEILWVRGDHDPDVFEVDEIIGRAEGADAEAEFVRREKSILRTRVSVSRDGFAITFGYKMVRRTPDAMPPTLPGWAFRFMSAKDADRYRRELEAHLWERVRDGEVRAARRERRRLTIAMLALGVVLRVRHQLGRAGT